MIVGLTEGRKDLDNGFLLSKADDDDDADHDPKSTE